VNTKVAAHDRAQLQAAHNALVDAGAACDDGPVREARVKTATVATPAYPTRDGILVFYASTFTTTPDAVGDVVDPRAFSVWLSQFRSKNRTLPIVFSHLWRDLNAIIGWARKDDIVVDTKGLLISAHLYMDRPEAQHVWQLARDGVLTGASFSFDVLDEQRDADGVNHLKLFSDVHEAGPCLVGVNRDAGIVAAKTATALVRERSAAGSQGRARAWLATVKSPPQPRTVAGQYDAHFQVGDLVTHPVRGDGVVTTSNDDFTCVEYEADGNWVFHTADRSLVARRGVKRRGTAASRRADVADLERFLSAARS
jgi:HK97 family phage prohead protease